MGQPNPPGDMPLIEGLDSSWNEFVSAIPEAQRAELAPKLKERISGYESQIEAVKPWQDFTKSGITPDHARTALDLFTTIENNPKQVYETIGQYLNITPKEAEALVEEVEDGDQDDPRIQTMQEQIDTLAQIALANRNQTQQEKLAAEQDAAIDNELTELRNKVGDFPEDEIVMRMLQKDLTADQAYEEFTALANNIRSRRPAPMIMGSGGSVPSRAIDVTKLNSKDTKSVVAQMLEASRNQG